eukprot:1692597-Prymnesium_polylepis.1
MRAEGVARATTVAGTRKSARRATTLRESPALDALNCVGLQADEVLLPVEDVDVIAESKVVLKVERVVLGRAHHRCVKIIVLLDVADRPVTTHHALVLVVDENLAGSVVDALEAVRLKENVQANDAKRSCCLVRR